MKEVWTKGFEVFRATSLLCLAVAAVQELSPLFSSRGSSTGLMIVLSAFVVYAMHRYILFLERLGEKPAGGTEKPHHFRFLMAVLLMTAILIPIVFLVFWAFLANWGVAALELAILVVVAIYGPLLALFGTILPHAAATGRIQPLLALSRGKRTFWQVMLRLVAGPFVVGIQVVGITVLLDQMNIPVDAGESFRSLDPLGAVIGILLGFFAMIASAQTSVILCQAYRHGRITNHAEVIS